MKKMMIAAFVAAAFSAGAGGLGWRECENCGKAEEADCVAVFKVTGSGKAVVSSPKGGYKTVSRLTVKKGALALVGDVCAADGQCCYSAGVFYATVKAGKKTFAFAAPVDLGVWSVFGKNLEKARESLLKPGKGVELESAMYLTAEDVDVNDETGDDEVDLSSVSFSAAAFGKVSFKASKGSKSTCSASPSCDPILTPKTYSGWFVGTYPCAGEENCFLCDCADTDVFGGTWKAAYSAKTTTVGGAMRMAGVSISED